MYWKFKLITIRENYSNTITKAYRNSNVIKDFSLHINSIAEFSKENDSKLLFIVWPNLKDVTDSSGNIEIILSLLQNFNYVDLTDALKEIPDSKLCASELDAHPSKLVHKKVAVYIREYLQKSNYFDFK